MAGTSKPARVAVAPRPSRLPVIRMRGVPCADGPGHHKPQSEPPDSPTAPAALAADRRRLRNAATLCPTGRRVASACCLRVREVLRLLTQRRTEPVVRSLVQQFVNKATEQRLLDAYATAIQQAHAEGAG